MSLSLRERVNQAVLRALDPVEELPFLSDLPISEAEKVIEEFIAEVQEECFRALCDLDTNFLDLLTPPVLYATYREKGISLSRETLYRICEEILDEEVEIVCDVEMPAEEGGGEIAEQNDGPKVYVMTMTI